MLETRRKLFGMAGLATLASLVSGSSANAQHFGWPRRRGARGITTTPTVVVPNNSGDATFAVSYADRPPSCTDCPVSSVDTGPPNIYSKSSTTTVTLTGDFPYQSYVVNIDDETKNARWTVFGNIGLSGTSSTHNFARMILNVRITTSAPGMGTGDPTTGKLNFTVDGGPGGKCVSYLNAQPVTYQA